MGPRIMRESMHLVETQLAFCALVPVVALGLEHRALGHAAGIDVQADRHRILAGIPDGVVLVRWNEAAGRAGAGLDRAHGTEVIALGFVVAELVLDDLERARPDAFDAPHATVVVDQRALART